MASLYNMVRIMVGTLLRVAQGKFQPEDIPHILEAKTEKWLALQRRRADYI